MKKCLKCNSSLKESPHNKLTGYKSYRCSNQDCNSLFDESEFSNEIKVTIPKNRPRVNQGVISVTQGSGKTMAMNHYMTIKQNKFTFLRQAFGDDLVDIAFDNQYQPRKVDNFPVYNSLSGGEKIIVDFMLHLYNPSLKNWPLDNINILDKKNKATILNIINNYNKYSF